MIVNTMLACLTCYCFQCLHSRLLLFLSPLLTLFLPLTPCHPLDLTRCYVQERFYFGDAVLPLFESGIPLLLDRLRQLPDRENVSGKGKVWGRVGTQVWGWHPTAT